MDDNADVGIALTQGDAQVDAVDLVKAECEIEQGNVSLERLRGVDDAFGVGRGEQQVDLGALLEQLGNDAAQRGVVLDVDGSRRAHGAVLQ